METTLPDSESAESSRARREDSAENSRRHLLLSGLVTRAKSFSEPFTAPEMEANALQSLPQGLGGQSLQSGCEALGKQQDSPIARGAPVPTEPS